ncbi:glycerate-2-kinase family protein, partial [Ameyamaea chiangmaiensis]
MNQNDIDARGREILRSILDSAIRAALPAHCLAQHLPEKPRGRCIVVGGGKASAAMAAALEAAWPDVPMKGLVVTRYGHAAPTAHIEIVEAAHPVPDEAGLQATARMMALAAQAGPDDLVLALISGGGSSLLSAPAEGISLADKQAVNRALLVAGAPIGLMNRVRPTLSRIKGGGLARAVP